MQLRLPKTVYLVIVRVLLAAVVGAYFAFLRDARRRKTLNTEAPATITGTEVRHRVDPETGQRFVLDTIVTFEYEINGRKFERVTRMNKLRASSFIPWGEAK